MTELDRETKAVIDALVYRLRNREEGTDDEPFAMEFVQALLGRGWRPSEARRMAMFPPHSHGGGKGPPEEIRAELEAARLRMAAATEAQKAREREAEAS
jgi:hypothetical protein